MYRCAGCGGNLEFDIATQQLKCKYCGSIFDPYVITKESDGYEEGSFEATFFACPQCGGEIYSTDNAAAGFCSFCGASTILTSRISKEKSPDYIIPFKITKEQCKKIYKNKLKKSIFAPKDMKDDKAFESFRGIYMPYWKYKFSSKGSMSVSAEKSHRKGDYIITDHYDLNGDMDTYYDGFTYDSSSSFYDNISEDIAPYQVKDSKEFTPSMLSGFYADVADVPENIYRNEAFNKAKDNTIKEFTSIPSFKGYTATNKRVQCYLDSEPAQRLMLPVWFMSYKKKDSVAYVTINGQTGKMSADIPIDNRKFLIFSLILAIPVFLVLNLLPAIIPSTLLTLVGILSFVTSLIYVSETYAISKRRLNKEDRGVEWNSGSRKHINSNKTKKHMNKTGKFVLFIIFAIMVAPSIITIIMLLGKLVNIPVCVITVSMCCLTGKMRKTYDIKGGFTLIINAAGLIVSSLILFISPVSDIYYYGGAILLTGCIFTVLSSIMVNYNKLIMRRPPQFNKRGGNDNAY